MRFFGFVVFFSISHLGVSQIFRFTMCHTHFWKTLPFLVAYGAIVAYILYVFDLNDFFFWQVALTSTWFFIFARNQSKMASAILRETGDDADFVRFVGESARLNARYYAYSSIVYVTVFAATYVWLYNR